MTATTAARRVTAGLAGLGLLVAACGSDDTNASQASTTITTTTAPAESTTTTTAPTTSPPSSESTSTTATPTTAPTTTTTVEAISTIDEGQDKPVINDWHLEAESVPCEASDLPGSPGGEAVLPANWAAGNADFVNFIVDGDQRPANSVRDVTGPGNVQVPCDPVLNDGHEVTLIAYTGAPGDRGPETAGETLIVITTATNGN